MSIFKTVSPVHIALCSKLNTFVSKNEINDHLTCIDMCPDYDKDLTQVNDYDNYLDYKENINNILDHNSIWFGYKLYLAYNRPYYYINNYGANYSLNYPYDDINPELDDISYDDFVYNYKYIYNHDLESFDTYKVYLEIEHDDIINFHELIEQAAYIKIKISFCNNNDLIDTTLIACIFNNIINRNDIKISDNKYLIQIFDLSYFKYNKHLNDNIENSIGIKINSSLYKTKFKRSNFTLEWCNTKIYFQGLDKSYKIPKKDFDSSNIFNNNFYDTYSHVYNSVNANSDEFIKLESLYGVSQFMVYVIVKENDEIDPYIDSIKINYLDENLSYEYDELIRYEYDNHEFVLIPLDPQFYSHDNIIDYLDYNIDSNTTTGLNLSRLDNEINECTININVIDDDGDNTYSVIQFIYAINNVISISYGTYILSGARFVH